MLNMFCVISGMIFAIVIVAALWTILILGIVKAIELFEKWRTKR